MVFIRYSFLFFVLILLMGCINKDSSDIIDNNEIKLPEPKLESSFSIEKTLAERRSVRSFEDKSLSIEEVSQLLWAAQGIDGVTSATRTAPSAGATQPLEVYLAVREVSGLEKGVYHYNYDKHSLEMVSSEDVSYNAPITIIIAADYDRTTGRYGDRGIRYVHIEVGHVAQNIQLQAISLGLGSYPIGAFNDARLKEQLGIDEHPLYVIPVGKV